ncbi:MAG TPA: Crp/Fnr family transcriptional regulator [Pyrinomonadaceae bacterium]|jgi:CRP-like cAMP-binding protein
MNPQLPAQPENRLLAALPPEEYERLRHHMEPISLSLGEVVNESGEKMNYVYFPVDSIISLLYTMLNGATAEMGLVGREGVVGIALFMGGGTMPNRAVVQSAGTLIRIKAKALQNEFRRGGTFQLLLLKYTQALMTQIAQTAVCNRLHPVEQRLCRWLLMTQDRAQSNTLQMTHEFISNMLGIQREAVSLAARRLQGKGVISYVRGRIKILDRAQLENDSCECYRVVKDEQERLLC